MPIKQESNFPRDAWPLDGEARKLFCVQNSKKGQDTNGCQRKKIQGSIPEI